jgi:molecular chaperone DnaK
MKMYEQAAAEAQATEGAEGSTTDDGVVDAEFEEVNEEKDNQDNK